MGIAVGSATDDRITRAASQHAAEGDCENQHEFHDRFLSAMACVDNQAENDESQNPERPMSPKAHVGNVRIGVREFHDG